MKTLFSVFFTILITINLLSQVPQKLSYQAVIRTNTNALVTSKTVGMQISLLQGSATGTSVYVETQNPTTNANGLVSLEIGVGTVTKGVFSAIDWDDGPYFAKIETDPNGGSAYSISGTSQLTTVPYALFSANGINKGTEAGQMIYWNGSAWTTIPIGKFNQVLNYCKGVPTWGPCPIEVGQFYQGGIIAYVDSTEKAGFIVAPVDQSTGVIYMQAPYNSDNTGTAIGAGLSNTIIHSEAFLAPWAAQICYYLELNGYSDWFLPSKDELNEIYKNKEKIGAIGNHIYWSSSEMPFQEHNPEWAQNFENGLQAPYQKNASHYVRAIRYFSTHSYNGILREGSEVGQMIYWNGTDWITVKPGKTDQTLNYCFGVPTWGPCPIKVGQSYRGGIVAYLLKPSDTGYDPNVPHGIIVAPTDQSTYAPWGCQGTIINGADGTEIGTGRQNTIDIMAGCPNPGIAARICGDLVLNGYDDWYLPSKDELNILFINKDKIGGLSPNVYWSSSETDLADAYYQWMPTGSQDGSGSKEDTPFYVRAIRSF